MKKHTIPTALLFTAFLIPLGCTGEPMTLDDIERLGKKTTNELHHRLQNEISKYSEKGIVDTTNFCLHNAQSITRNYNRELGDGINIKRISLKNRNDLNKATSDEAPILEALELLSRSNAYLPEQIIQINKEGNYKYYHPIMLTKRGCMACHGQSTNITEEVRTLIAKNYPNDKAICYNKGDFRGAFVVEISQKTSNQPTLKDRQ
jgi:hypothetical protein